MWSRNATALGLGAGPQRRQLDRLPVPANAYPRAECRRPDRVWGTHPTNDTTRFDTWDTETNTALASRTLAGNEDQDVTAVTCRTLLLGVDADGIGYLLERGGRSPDHPVGPQGGHARADGPELRPHDGPSPRQFDFGWNASRASRRRTSHPTARGRSSPDRPRGDSAPDCCSTELRVRPVGPAESLEPGDVVPLQLPEGIPAMALWDSYSDRGTWGVLVGDQRHRASGCGGRRTELPRALSDRRRSVRAGLRSRPQQQQGCSVHAGLGARLGFRPPTGDRVTSGPRPRNGQSRG